LVCSSLALHWPWWLATARRASGAHFDFLGTEPTFVQNLSTDIHRVIHIMGAKVAPSMTCARVRSYAHKRAVVHNLWAFIHDAPHAQNQRRGLPFPGSLPLAPHFSHVCELSTSCVDEGGELWTRTQHLPRGALPQNRDPRPDRFRRNGAPTSNAHTRWNDSPCAVDTALRLWHITWQGAIFTPHPRMNDCMFDVKRGARCDRLVERAVERSS
jgi:hypothetical protein